MPNGRPVVSRWSFRRAAMVMASSIRIKSAPSHAGRICRRAGAREGLVMEGVCASRGESGKGQERPCRGVVGWAGRIVRRLGAT